MVKSNTCRTNFFYSLLVGVFLWGALMHQPLWAQMVLVDRAYDHLAANEPSKAKELLDVAIEDESTKTSARVWYLHAFTHKELFLKNSQSADRKQALSSLEKCQELDKEKQYENESRELANFLYKTLYNQGVEAFNDRSYTMAVEFFSEYISFKDKASGEGHYFAQAHYYNGFSNLMKKNYDEALKNYQSALDLGYSNARIYDDITRIFKDQKKLPQAQEWVEKGVEQYPEDKNLKISRISLYQNMKEFDKVVEYTESYLEQDPRNVNMILVLGSAYQKLWDETKGFKEKDKYFVKAKAVYEQAIDLEPENISANYDLGLLLFNKAVDLINMSTENYDQDLKEFVGIVKLCSDLFKESRPYFEKVHQVDPKNENAIKALRGIYYDLNLKDKEKEMNAKLEALQKN